LENRLPTAGLQSLAARAVDATRQTGVAYADIRIAEQHRLDPGIVQASLISQMTYGVRALVDGVWGFAYGRDPSPDAVTRCAQAAVAGARVAAQATNRRADRSSGWMPPPVATGEWRTPIQIDPFEVPLQQHSEVSEALNALVKRMPEMDTPGGIGMQWTRETRVFASTAGSHLTQYLYRSQIDGAFHVSYGRNALVVKLPDLGWTSRGYEAVLIPDTADRFKNAVEDVLWLTRLPMATIDVGRYPVVLDGHTMGSVLLSVVGPSLELDRVLGDEVDASGGSRFTLDLLGAPVASPLLTLTGHRNMPEIQAVQWDDDGAVPTPHTVIKEGVLVDYHTSNSTVAALTEWYQRNGKAVASNGCATTVDPQTVVTIQPPHLQMSPGTARRSLEELCHGMAHGIVVLTGTYLATDQNLSSASFSAEYTPCFEIKQGKLIRRIQGSVLQLNTLPFLKGLVALGDETTICRGNQMRSKGYPWQDTPVSAVAPAALFKEINVMSAKE